MENDFLKFLVLRDAGTIDGVSGVLLSGEPGTGKTRWAKLFAQNIGAELLKYQCHEGTGKEELLYDIDVAGVVEKLSPHGDGGATNKKEFLSKGLLPLACEKSHKGKVVFLLDELEKARQAVDNFLLDFLQSGEVYDPNLGNFKANLQNLFFVATTNEQRMLSEPLYRRLRRKKFQFPNSEELVHIVKTIVPVESEKLGDTKLKFLVNLVIWYREQQDVVKKITAPEMARLVSELTVCQDEDQRSEVVLSWFSPHEEDWAVLNRYGNNGGIRYITGMLK